MDEFYEGMFEDIFGKNRREVFEELLGRIPGGISRKNVERIWEGVFGEILKILWRNS